MVRVLSSFLFVEIRFLLKHQPVLYIWRWVSGLFFFFFLLSMLVQEL